MKTFMKLCLILRWTVGWLQKQCGVVCTFKFLAGKKMVLVSGSFSNHHLCERYRGASKVMLPAELLLNSSH